jgi:UDP-3-O-[3-hydroxymyristoyl] glucosamine N-acyltransferase
VMGDRSIASSKSGVHGEVAAGEVVSGYPAIPNRLWLRCAAAFNKLPEMARALRHLEKRRQELRGGRLQPPRTSWPHPPARLPR